MSFKSFAKQHALSALAPAAFATTGGLDTQAGSYELPIAVNGIAGIDLIVGTSAPTQIGGGPAPTVLMPGNVGIGTTQPNSALHLYGTGSEYLSVQGGPANQAGISFSDTANGLDWAVYKYDGGGQTRDLNFWNPTTGSTVALSQSTGGVAVGAYAGVYTPPKQGIIVSGSVGIGTTNPASQLQVAGEVQTGDSGAPCTPAPGGNEGALRYNYATHNLEVCNGTAWVPPNSTSGPPPNESASLSGTFYAHGTYDTVTCSGSTDSAGNIVMTTTDNEGLYRFSAQTGILSGFDEMCASNNPCMGGFVCIADDDGPSLTAYNGYSVHTNAASFAAWH